MNRPWNQPIEMGSAGHTSLNFIPLGIRLIGLKLYAMPECDGVTIRKIHCMQKSLYGREDWFYFYKGFQIIDNPDGGSEAMVQEDAFDSNFCLYNSIHHFKKNKADKLAATPLQNLSISAIIGQNGSGKSTLIDMIIRVINNLSAAIYSENYIYASAQHLHYIENVYASLAVYLDDKIKILTVKGHHISIDTLEHDNDQYKGDDIPKVQRYITSQHQEVLADGFTCDEILQGDEGMKSILNDWFYTIISNYSLYAYNFNDYFLENTSKKKIDALRPQMEDVPGKEDYCWLKGVFHKNDGYQTPIVVNPMRQNGYINAEKENVLGKQNLISLAFKQVEYREDYEQIVRKDFPFRIINQTHQVVTIYHTWVDKDKYEGFKNTYLYGKHEVERKDREKYENLEKAYPHIRKYWAKRLGLCQIKEKADCFINKDHYIKTIAWDYVVYKTLKILGHYIIYRDDFKFFSQGLRTEEIDIHLDKLVKDNTHKTRKLRRTLAFIKLFDEHYSCNSGLVDIDDAFEWMQKHIGKPLYTGDFKDYHSIEVEDLLPPPCCQDVQIGLVELRNIEKYKFLKSKYQDLIPIEGLSSGERQIAYSIGNILYHAVNIDSTVDDANGGDNLFQTKRYSHLNILMDEVELYFHPDLQRRFVKLLVDAVTSSTWMNITSMNITLITHSPFVLSDIPKSNVLCLGRDDTVDVYDQTFGANIHDMFNNTFILPYTIGELAKSRIEEFVKIYNEQTELWEMQDGLGKARTESTNAYNVFMLHKDKFEYLFSTIGDDYLHKELEEMYNELDSFYSQLAN